MKWLGAVVICPWPSLTVNMSPQHYRNSSCSCSDSSPYASLFGDCQNIFFHKGPTNNRKTNRPLSMLIWRLVKSTIIQNSQTSSEDVCAWVGEPFSHHLLALTLCAWIRRTISPGWICVRVIVTSFSAERNRQRVFVCVEEFKNARGGGSATDSSNCACNSLHHSSLQLFVTARLCFFLCLLLIRHSSVSL